MKLSYTIFLAALFGVATIASPALAETARAGSFNDDTKSYNASPDDVGSIDAIMAAVYDVISGPAGAPRDWDRFDSLFAEGARLIPYNAGNPAGVSAMSPQDYRERAGAFFQENGFFETEIARRMVRYGNIVHVWSAYQSKRAPEDAEPFARGINSFQLMYHNDRWWVVTIYWQGETEDNPIPEEFLQSL